MIFGAWQTQTLERLRSVSGGLGAFFQIGGLTLPTTHDPRHIFACFYQIARAFHNIFLYIIGSSLSAARLRASVWHSIFTHDLRRYWRGIYAHMGDFPTLIMGPSGTGKELVARAIALTRYVPFDATKLVFEHDPEQTFHPINVAALPATLMESELFGHRRGAFTGALEDRKGWLEICPPFGSVFLDELGDLELALQVKLLRVMRRAPSSGGRHGKPAVSGQADRRDQSPSGHGHAARTFSRGPILSIVFRRDYHTDTRPKQLTGVARSDAGSGALYGAPGGWFRG